SRIGRARDGVALHPPASRCWYRDWPRPRKRFSSPPSLSFHTVRSRFTPPFQEERVFVMWSEVRPGIRREGSSRHPRRGLCQPDLMVPAATRSLAASPVQMPSPGGSPPSGDSRYRGDGVCCQWQGNWHACAAGEQCAADGCCSAGDEVCLGTSTAQCCNGGFVCSAGRGCLPPFFTPWGGPRRS